jgi:hypothetical protein
MNNLRTKKESIVLARKEKVGLEIVLKTVVDPETVLRTETVLRIITVLEIKAVVDLEIVKNLETVKDLEIVADLVETRKANTETTIMLKNHKNHQQQIK